jgi:hypothetical protein
VNHPTRRDFLGDFLWGAFCTSALAAEPSGPPLVLRQQVAGEWCFVKFPPKWRRGEVVLILHGAGEWVDATKSSWETQPGATRLMQALLEAGYAVAQSNGAARHGNGMWGNAETQTATVAFAGWIASHYRSRKFHALAVSAGNLVLMNLLLGRRMRFATATMLAPCLSIASEYRCPGGINRVRTIAEAYHFTPASGCPGDPEQDTAFLSATENMDPMRRLQGLSNAQLRSILGKTRLLAIYESGDPRVPPAENILPFSHRLLQAGVPLSLIRMEADTHGSQELFLRYTPRIVAFL